MFEIGGRYYWYLSLVFGSYKLEQNRNREAVSFNIIFDMIEL